MIDVKLLKKICEVPGTSGFEQKIRAVVIKEVSPYVDSVEVDAMGNVIALKKGTASKKDMKRRWSLHTWMKLDLLSLLLMMMALFGFIH